MLAQYYRSRGFIIAAQDEATFGLLPNIVRGWARKGCRPIILQHPQHKKINVFGARSKRDFVFLFSKKKNQGIFVRQMDQLRRRWGRVCLFTDNAPWHKGDLVDKFLAAHQKIRGFGTKFWLVKPTWRMAFVPKINVS